MRAQKPRAGERKAVLVPCGACTRAGRTGTSTYNSRTLAITLQLIAEVQRNIRRKRETRHLQSQLLVGREHDSQQISINCSKGSFEMESRKTTVLVRYFWAKFLFSLQA